MIAQFFTHICSSMSLCFFVCLWNFIGISTLNIDVTGKPKNEVWLFKKKMGLYGASATGLIIAKGILIEDISPKHPNV